MANQVSKEQTDKDAKLALKIILGIAALLIVYVIATPYPPAPSKSSAWERMPRIPDPCAGAQIAAERLVLARLKAPSTARFNPLLEGRVTGLANGKCLVEGWVDAQNSFGAMLRMNWRIIMVDAGDRYILDVLQIGDQLYGGNP